MYIHLCLCMCVCVHACVCTYICAYICHHTYALCVFVCVYAHINAPKSALGGTECVHTVCTQSVRAYRRTELGRPCAHVCGCPAIEVIVQRVYRKLIHVVKNLYVYMSCIYINIHIYRNTYINIDIHTCYIYMYIYIYTYIYIYAYNIYAYIYMHTYIYAYIYIYTHHVFAAAPKSFQRPDIINKSLIEATSLHTIWNVSDQVYLPEKFKKCWLLRMCGLRLLRDNEEKISVASRS